MTLIEQAIPDLSCSAVVGGKEIQENFNFGDLVGKYLLLVFYPLNFTYVCPTELHAFQDKLPEFEKRGCNVVACSVDSPYCTLAWLHTPIENGGIKGVTFTILSDLNKNIARAFDVLKEEAGVAFRATFLVDKEGIIRHASVNDLALGRNVDEYLRLLDGLQHVETHGDVCPAGWKKGEKSIKPTHDGLVDYFAK